MSYPYGDDGRRYSSGPPRGQGGSDGYVRPDGRAMNFHPEPGHPQASQGFWRPPAHASQQYPYGHDQHQRSLSQVLQNSRQHEQPGPHQQYYPPPQAAPPPQSYYPQYDNVAYSVPQPNYQYPQQPHHPNWQQHQYGTHPQQQQTPYRSQAYVQNPGPSRSPPQPQAPANTAQRYHNPQVQQQQQQQQPRQAPRQTPQSTPHRSSSNAAAASMGNTQSSRAAPQQAHTSAPTPTPTPGAHRTAPTSYHTPRPQPSSTPSTPRQFAHVEIPVQRSSPSDMAPPPAKRRRSNDGDAIVVDQQPQKGPSRPQSIKSEPQPDIPRSIDYQATLLALADEYIQVAYSSSKDVVTQEDLDDYHRLMSMAMSCLESVLKNTRLADPRHEARIRLRLASLILDETEDMGAAEDVLSKGILLCERNKFQDLKYAMQHMLIKVMFRTKEKAAFRSLDRMIDEVTALKLYNWVYAFRFLRVSLGFERPSENTIQTRHLAALTAIADSQRNVSVKVIAATLEALLHLRSGSPESVQLAQRCLATAHTHQLDPDLAQLGPVRSLVAMLRLACQLIECKYDGLETVLQDMQNQLDQKPVSGAWNKDGTLAIPVLSQSNNDVEVDTAGLMRKLGNGDTALSFAWLTRSQLYALVYFISGLARGQTNTADGKAERYYGECLKLVGHLRSEIPQPYSAIGAGLEWKTSTDALLRSYLAFAASGRAAWPEARSQLDQVIASLDAQHLDLDDGHKSLVLYIDAMIKQATGDLESAHKVYKDSRLTFEPKSKSLTADRDLRALACLNSILILRCLSSHERIMAEMLLSTVEQYCIDHHNPAINSAYRTVRATMESQGDGIIETKQNLQIAVTAARTARSNRLMSVCMNIMTSSFFHNIVGDQAEKSATAGRSLATKSQDKLWIAVADGMLGDTYERMGKRANAMHVRLEAEHSLEAVPDAVKRKIETMYDD